MRSQLAGGSQCNENDYYPSFEDFIDPNSPVAGNTDVNDTSSGNGGKEASIYKTSSGSRKKESSDAVLMEFLGNLHAETNARLEMISARIGYDKARRLCKAWDGGGPNSSPALPFVQHFRRQTSAPRSVYRDASQCSTWLCSMPH